MTYYGCVDLTKSAVVSCCHTVAKLPIPWMVVNFYSSVQLDGLLFVDFTITRLDNNSCNRYHL